MFGFCVALPAPSHQESCYSQDLVLSPAVPFAHLGNLIRYKVPGVVKYGAMQVGSHGKVEKYVVPIESAECPDKEAQSVVKPPQWTEAQCTVE